MTQITHSILIERPIDDVFHFLTNLENDQYWWKAAVFTRKLTEGPVGLGTEFDEAAKLMFITVQNHLCITAWEAPNRAQFTNTSDQLAYTVDYLFASEGSRTRYTLKAQLEPKGFLKWVFPLTMRVLHSQLDSHFKELKRYMESEAYLRQHGALSK